MSIIKNLIIKNQLGKELRNIENDLYESGYYQKERELDRLTYLPDEYGELYTQIHDEYGDLLKKKQNLSSQLHLLSGSNLFKSHDDIEYTK